MQFDTKFAIGDAVWMIENYRAIRANIAGIEIQQLGSSAPCIRYLFGLYGKKGEQQVFKTREELIKYINR